jgi:hypothetical protein
MFQETLGSMLTSRQTTRVGGEGWNQPDDPGGTTGVRAPKEDDRSRTIPESRSRSGRTETKEADVPR